MKWRNVFLVAFIVVVAACSKDLADVTFDANYEVDLPVALSGSKAEYNFVVSDTIDPMSNAEATKYMEKIKAWEITSLKADFKESSENFKLIKGTLTIKSESGTEIASWELNNIDIETTNPYQWIMDNANGQFAIINKILAAKTKFIVIFEGKTDKTDITYKLGAKVGTKVTANPL